MRARNTTWKRLCRAKEFFLLRDKPVIEQVIGSYFKRFRVKWKAGDLRFGREH